MMTTAIQKLLRLAEIHKELAAVKSDSFFLDAERVRELQIERSAILASVSIPPGELEGNTDCYAWARAFVQICPGIDIELAAIWFDECLTAGHSIEREEVLSSPARPIEVIENGKPCAYQKVERTPEKITVTLMPTPVPPPPTPPRGIYKHKSYPRKFAASVDLAPWGDPNYQHVDDRDVAKLLNEYGKIADACVKVSV